MPISNLGTILPSFAKKEFCSEFDRGWLGGSSFWKEQQWTKRVRNEGKKNEKKNYQTSVTTFINKLTVDYT